MSVLPFGDKHELPAERRHGPRADYIVELHDLDSGRRFELGVVRKVASEATAVRRGYWRVRELALQTGRVLVRAFVIYDRPRLTAHQARRRGIAPPARTWMRSVMRWVVARMLVPA